MTTSEHFRSLGCGVLTVSDTRTFANDSSGQFLADQLQVAGHQLCDRQIVADDRYQIRAWVSKWIASSAIDVILVTGGTGLTGRDGTPEAIIPLLDKTIEGFGELFRALSYQQIGTATIQSRALAGTAGGTIVFCLPGSNHACQTAWQEMIVKQIDSRTKPCNLVALLPRLLE